MVAEKNITFTRNIRIFEKSQKQLTSSFDDFLAAVGLFNFHNNKIFAVLGFIGLAHGRIVNEIHDEFNRSSIVFFVFNRQKQIKGIISKVFEGVL